MNVIAVKVEDEKADEWRRLFTAFCVQWLGAAADAKHRGLSALYGSVGGLARSIGSLKRACRLALEIPEVPDCFQEFNLLSWEGHGKYNVDKARRILGFEPTECWDAGHHHPLCTLSAFSGILRAM